MYYDYHMHSNFSPDSKTSMEDMIKKSINLNLTEICFTDHMEHNEKGDSTWMIDYDKYFKEYNILKEKYKDKISIKIGVEMGLQTHIIDKCRNDVLTNPFDFVILSQHAIDEKDFSLRGYFEGKTQKEAYETYFLKLYEIIKNFKDYSVLGHLDLIKRYGNYDSLLDDKLFSDIIEEILKTVINDNRGIEVNTSCYRYKLPDLTPSRYILKMYKDLGGEIITTGSDSHSDTYIASNFDYIYYYLKDIGFNYICYFDKMKPNFIKI